MPVLPETVRHNTGNAKSHMTTTKEKPPAPMFALPYSDLQEIHSLVGMVCGWRMSLPKKMISQAKLVETHMITLNRIDLSQQERLRQAIAFKAKFKKVFP